jgi:hypothetical protein
MSFTVLVLFLATFSRLAWTANPNEEAQAGIDDKAKAAYFVLGSAGYVFALNVAENGDVYYHMNAPAKHSWMYVCGHGRSPKRGHTRACGSPALCTDYRVGALALAEA